METITSDQLGKYEDILEQISNEYKISEELKRELENENDKIILYNLTEPRINQKLSSTSVKIFSNILNLLSLYEDELQMDFGEFLKCQNSKYYLIEVYTAKALFQKLKSLNCIVSITIITGDKCISKSVSMPKQLPLVEIIAVDENVVDSVVETSLIFPDENWMTIKLETINVDISYHFQKQKTLLNSKTNDILKLSKMYDDHLDFKKLKNEMLLEYVLRCEVDHSEFVEAILQNSYHNLGMELFLGLTNDDKNEFVIELSHGFGKYEITYNRKNKIQIKGNVEDLWKLKKYLCKAFHKQTTVVPKLSGVKELQENIPLSLQEVQTFYNNIRKCWSNLAV